MKNIYTLPIFIIPLVILLTGSVYGGALLNCSETGNVYLHQVCEIVEVNILDQVATTTVYAYFSDETLPDPSNLTLFFPLPTSANVFSAETWIDGEWYPCSLVAAIDSTDTGGYGTEDPELNEYLSIKPFVLKLPGYHPLDVRVRFSYIELLPYDFGEISYYYPWHRPTFHPEAVDSYQITMSLHTTREIDSMTCNHSWTALDHSASEGSAEVTGISVAPEEPWYINFYVASDSIGFSAMFFKEEYTDTGFFLFIIEPPLDVDAEEVVPKDFIFVIDNSLTMIEPDRTKLEQAMEAADSCVLHLFSDDKFNILGFNEVVFLFNPASLVYAIPSNKAAAVEYINAMSCAWGTNINLALLTALDLFPGERLSELVFLTDGLPLGGVDNPVAIRENVRMANSEIAVPIYIFGIGHNVDSLFLKNLAFENRGVYLGVTPTNIAALVAELFSYINVPVLSNPELEVPSVEVFDIYPRFVPAVFAGRQLVISGRYLYGGISDVLVNGEVASGDTTYIYPDIEFPEFSDTLSFVATVWAKQYIDYWIAYIDAYGFDEEIAADIVDIALRYGIVCRYTEYEGPLDPEDPEDPSVEEAEGIYSIAINAQGSGVEILINVPDTVEVLDIHLLSSPSGTGDFALLAHLRPGVAYTDALPLGAVRYYQFEILYRSGEVYTSRIFEVVNLPPGQISIYQTYPNPFNSRVTLDLVGDFGIEHQLSIYDILGMEVKTLTVKGSPVVWDGRDNSGKELPSGVYFVKPRGVAPPKTVILLK